MEPVSQNTTSDAYLGSTAIQEIRKGPALIWKKEDILSYEYEFTTSRSAIEASAIPGKDYFSVTSKRKTYINGVFVKEDSLNFTVEKNKSFYSEIDGGRVTIKWEYNYSEAPIATKIHLVQIGSNITASLDFLQEHMPVCIITAEAHGEKAFAISNKPVASDITIGLEITTYDGQGGSEIWYDNMIIHQGGTKATYDIPNGDIKIYDSISLEHDNTYIYKLA